MITRLRHYTARYMNKKVYFILMVTILLNYLHYSKINEQKNKNSSNEKSKIYIYRHILIIDLINNAC
jgi:hypothetical protein